MKTPRPFDWYEGDWGEDITVVYDPDNERNEVDPNEEDPNQEWEGGWYYG